MIAQTSVSASVTSGAAINPNTAFMAMMALGKKGDDKITTMERMALFSMMMQKQQKTDLTIVNSLPAGFGTAAFTFGSAISYTSDATTGRFNMPGSIVDVEI